MSRRRRIGYLCIFTCEGMVYTQTTTAKDRHEAYGACLEMMREEGIHNPKILFLGPGRIGDNEVKQLMEDIDASQSSDYQEF